MLKEHTGPINSVAYRPDGQQIASGSHDNTIRLWRVDGHPGSVLKGHTDAVRSLAYRPDGQQLASGSDDKTVRLWGVDGSIGPVLEGHTSYVFRVAYRTDGQQLASGSWDDTIHLWGTDDIAGPVLSKTDAPDWFNSTKIKSDDNYHISYQNNSVICTFKTETQSIRLWSYPRLAILNAQNAHFDNVQGLSVNNCLVLDEVGAQGLLPLLSRYCQKDTQNNNTEALNALLYLWDIKHDAATAYSLGQCYEQGWGVTTAFKTAISWYEKAANANHSESQFALGQCYELGSLGVKKNYKKAFAWYQKAATTKPNYIPAQYALSFLYEMGQGVTKDLDEAQYLFMLAWENGLTGENYRTAFKAIAEKGSRYANYYLGQLYGSGQTKDFIQNHEEALNYYEKSASKGYELAIKALETLSEKNILPEHKIKAERILATLYEQGTSDIPQDITKAIEWYKKAAKNKDAESKYHLGVLYQIGYKPPLLRWSIPSSGHKLEQSEKDAIYYYSQAARQGHTKAKEALEHLNIDMSTLNIKSFETNIGTIILEDEFIGEGGYAHVYRAYKNGEPNKFLAVKKFGLNMSESSKEANQINEEFTTILTFATSSNYFVKCHAQIWQPPQHYGIVMDYMPQGSLHKALTDHSLTTPQKYIIAQNVAWGLKEIHRKNKNHCDIKSENILLTEKYRAKITDFGLAQTHTSARQQTGIKGTVPFYPPEILKDSHEKTTADIYTAFSDMYTYGVLLWELVTEKSPYANKLDDAIMMLIKEGKTEALSEITDPRFAHLIKQCWKYEPKERPTALEALEMLGESYDNLYESPPLSIPDEQATTQLLQPPSESQYKNAFDAYKHAANQKNNAEACYTLATFYSHGHSPVDQDVVEARNWFEKAANLKHLKGCLELARFFAYRHPNETNPEQHLESNFRAAKDWIKKANDILANRYTLDLMPTSDLKPNVIYVKSLSEHQIEYKVLHKNNGELRELEEQSGNIDLSKLGSKSKLSVDFPKEINQDNILRIKLKDIEKIIFAASKQGHTLGAGVKAVKHEINGLSYEALVNAGGDAFYQRKLANVRF